MTDTNLGTGATVLSPRNRKLRLPRLPITIALIIANALTFIALFIAWSSNAELQKRVVDAERISAERAEEVKEMTHKCVRAVRDTLDELDEDQQEPAEEPKAQPAPGAGIDSGSNPAERW